MHQRSTISSNDTSNESLKDEIEGLKTAMAVQEATMAGAQATQSATQAGMAATQTAAAVWYVVDVRGRRVALSVGMFLALALVGAARR